MNEFKKALEWFLRDEPQNTLMFHKHGATTIKALRIADNLMREMEKLEKDRVRAVCGSLMYKQLCKLEARLIQIIKETEE